MQILMHKTKKLRANGMPLTSATCANTPKNKKNIATSFLTVRLHNKKYLLTVNNFN